MLERRNYIGQGIATTVRCCVLHAHVFLFFLYLKLDTCILVVCVLFQVQV